MLKVHRMFFAFFFFFSFLFTLLLKPTLEEGGHAVLFAPTRVAHPAWSRLRASKLKAGHASDLEGSQHLL